MSSHRHAIKHNSAHNVAKIGTKGCSEEDPANIKGLVAEEYQISIKVSDDSNKYNANGYFPNKD